MKLRELLGAVFVLSSVTATVSCTPFKNPPDASLEARLDGGVDQAAAFDVMAAVDAPAGGGGGAVVTGGTGGTATGTGAGGAGGTVGGTGGRGIGASSGSGGGSGGNAGSGGPAIAGNTGQVCPSTQHNCAGICVDNDAIAHCGSLCDACVPPAGGTATCDGARCDFTCGSMKKCANKCTTGCCVDTDCAAQAGMAGQCDTSTNTCSYTCAAGFKPCGVGRCIPTTGCCAQSDCPGACRACSAANTCVAVVNADDTDSCAGTCDATGACKSNPGQTCQTGAGCITGTTCAPDGYCCNTACANSCEACDLPGFLGTCTPIASGNPHGNRAACGSAGTTCGGTCGNRPDGACAYPTTSCGGPQVCVGGVRRSASVCDGAGQCPAPVMTTCATGCNAAGNDCLTCAAGQAVCNGTCCQAGQGCCSGACVDTTSSPQHCGGGCQICAGLRTRCSAGQCVQCLTDADCAGSTPSCDPATHACVCRRPSPGNVLLNPGFNTGRENWIVGPINPFWSPDDADGCLNSGSLEDPGSDTVFSQCVRVTGNTRYFIGAKFKGPNYLCETAVSSDLACQSVIDSTRGQIFETAGSPVWTQVSITLTTPASARSMQIFCDLFATNMDQIYINASANTF
jgi:hypothetical protein